MKKPSWQITLKEYEAAGLQEKYGISYDLYVAKMADEGKIVLPFGKEPYEMNRTEFKEYIDTGYYPEIGLRNPKSMLEDVDKYGRREAERRWTIEHALATGKAVPTKVLKDYPDLKPKHQPRPLPPDAVNVQKLPFNSDLFTCYGKQTKRGFRAYCRRK